VGRETLGSSDRGWDFDYEGLWRFATLGSADICAWTVASDTGYRFPTARFKPRISAAADISSGDNPNSKTLGTFNALFPKGNYFGALATTGAPDLSILWIHPRIETTLPHGVTASFDWIVQWRQNLNDGVYAVPGFLIRAADGSRVRFVGHRPGTEIRWQANRHRWLRADYGIFYAGRFLRETQPGRNLNYVALAETIPLGTESHFHCRDVCGCSRGCDCDPKLRVPGACFGCCSVCNKRLGTGSFLPWFSLSLKGRGRVAELTP